MRKIIHNLFILVVFLTNNIVYGQNQCHRLFENDLDIGISKQLQKIEEMMGQDEVKQILLRERVALDVLSKSIITDKKINEEVNVWINHLASKEISVLEHTAIAAIYRSKVLKELQKSDPMLHTKMNNELERILATSWLRLTGDPKPVEFGSRLPKHVTKNENERTFVFEEAVFEETTSIRRDGASGYFSPHRNIYKIAIVPAAILISAAFSITSAKILAGLFAGVFVVSSLTEAFTHKYVAHDSMFARVNKVNNVTLKKMILRFRPMIKYLEDTYSSHQKIHHGTFGNFSSVDANGRRVVEEGSYTRMFTSSRHEEATVLRAEKLGLDVERLKKENFAVTMDFRGRLALTSLCLPLELAIASLTQFDPVFNGAVFLGGLLFQFNSADMHPYLHQKRAISLSKASPLMKLFLRTTWLEGTARRHWVHHKNAAVNFNISLLNFGDFLLGTLQKPNLEQFLLMRDEQIIGATWDIDNLEISD